MNRKRLGALVAACALGVGGAGSAALASQSAPVTHTVTLNGFLFNGKKNATLTAHLNDSLRFVWASANTMGHNILMAKAPVGFKRVTEPTIAMHHAPVTVKLTKKGVYQYYCAPHRPLGMVITVTVR